MRKKTKFYLSNYYTSKRRLKRKRMKHRVSRAMWVLYMLACALLLLLWFIELSFDTNSVCCIHCTHKSYNEGEKKWIERRKKRKEKKKRRKKPNKYKSNTKTLSVCSCWWWRSRLQKRQYEEETKEWVSEMCMCVCACTKSMRAEKNNWANSNITFRHDKDLGWQQAPRLIWVWSETKQRNTHKIHT